MPKIALITGGNSGIGKSSAMLFAQRGYQVAIAARRIEVLEKVEQEIASAGGIVMVIAADVSVAADVSHMVEAVISTWGQIDVLVHAAGIAYPGTILETDEQIWDATIDTKLLRI